MVATDELASDQEGLREPIGPRLLGIGNRQTPLAAILEQRLEPRAIRRGCDDENLAYAGEHQGRQRVVDHRLVVDRQELLADRQGDWVEPCTSSARENIPFIAPRPLRLLGA